LTHVYELPASQRFACSVRRRLMGANVAWFPHRATSAGRVEHLPAAPLEEQVASLVDLVASLVDLVGSPVDLVGNPVDLVAPLANLAPLAGNLVGLAQRAG